VPFFSNECRFAEASSCKSPFILTDTDPLHDPQIQQQDAQKEDHSTRWHSFQQHASRGKTRISEVPYEEDQ
jgi:hypothetical protein